MVKKILWNRKLSCGHNRTTDIAYMMKNYDKPGIGDKCFCRECNQTVKIIEVKEVK